MKVRDILAIAPAREGEPSPASPIATSVTRPHATPQPFHEDARGDESEAAFASPKKRPFLPRPLGQEDALDPWEVWTPLFDWLIEHHSDHFHAVCDAEDVLNRMERQGITSGKAYELACCELLTRFETARRLKLKAEVKVWIQ